MVHSKVFLIGYMASGKSTLGIKIAEQLNRTFLDTDTFIENKTGLKIHQIVKEKSWDYFRALETEVLETACDPFQIISTGGGMPCSDLAISTMKSLGLVVYLRCSEATLFDRLSQTTQIRPSLIGLSETALKTHISMQLKERSHFYNQADCILDADQDSDTLMKSLELVLNELS
jgi:shikimate kinase